jgi:hypothetical protein
LAGEPTTSDLLRVVRTMMEALSISLEEAIERVVPGDRQDEIRARYEEEATQVIRRIRGVSADGGPKPWFADWDPASGYYWIRQRQYLLDTVGRTERELESLDDDSDRVLSHLEHPLDSEPFTTRGLVIGYVQSGKTANFSALIAKAADVGYRIVIVLTGMHNSLRQQTQRRLDRELGLVEGVGVGLPDHGLRWLSQTTAELNGDFQPGTSDPNVLQGNERVIFVVKKFGTVLDRLISFIEQANPPENVPVLIIDDEADQASINTGGNRGVPQDDEDELQLSELVDEVDPELDLEEELDPSKINAKIRTIINLFSRVAYVGYTATPFANVLVDQAAEDREVFEDLFPKDFILTLPAGPGYVGAERLFGRDTLDGTPEGQVEGLDVIRYVPDSDLPAILPVECKLEEFTPAIPESMEMAIMDWVLATGGLLARVEEEDHPSCMLIHTHQRTRVQNELAPQVQEVISRFRQEWRYGGAGFRQRLRDRWQSEFDPVTVRIDPLRARSFDEVEAQIDRLFRDPVRVLVLNSTTEDVLDYEDEPNIKAILIGGNRLSRGMTLEGLLVSYFVRPSPYYDTLLQMGRWFGYREQIADLTRLWTTQLLGSWFRDLALREEELRQQVAAAERAGLSPEAVGYRIRTHPAMMVTAQNKMGAGRVRDLSYAGRLIQTTRFMLRDPQWLEGNHEAVRAFFASLPDNFEVDPSGAPLWRGVDWQLVVELLGRYRTVQDRITFDADAARHYIEAQVAAGELVHWDIAIGSLRDRDPDLGGVDLGVSGTPEFNAISRTRLKDDPESIGALTNPAQKDGDIRRGDEEIGMTDDQIMRARKQLGEEEYETIREALLAQRDPAEGLLVVYPISPHSQPRTNSRKRLALFEDSSAAPPVIGLALGFPRSDSAATVEYLVNEPAAEVQAE